MKILILCTGNSCRSQMAEGFLKSFDSRLEVYSAGTQPAPHANPNAVAAMKELGIDISGNRPKSVDIFLADPFDYVITVCGGAQETCPRVCDRREGTSSPFKHSYQHISTFPPRDRRSGTGS